MSHQTYNLAWQHAMQQIAEVLQVENPQIVHHATGQPVEKLPADLTALRTSLTISEAYHHYYTLYHKYHQVLYLLTQAYDQIVQPQKRSSIKVVLDLVLIRIVEVRTEMLKFINDGESYSDFIHDNHLQQQQQQQSTDGAATIQRLDVEEPIVPQYFVDYLQYNEQTLSTHEQQQRQFNGIGGGSAGGNAVAEYTQQLQYQNLDYGDRSNGGGGSMSDITINLGSMPDETDTMSNLPTLPSPNFPINATPESLQARQLLTQIFTDYQSVRSSLPSTTVRYSYENNRDAHNDNDSSSHNSRLPKMTKQQAVEVLLRYERTRQTLYKSQQIARQKGLPMPIQSCQSAMSSSLNSLYPQQSHHKTPAKRPPRVIVDPNDAAVLIQKVFRGHLVRQQVRNEREQELRDLGLMSGAVEAEDEQHGATYDSQILPELQDMKLTSHSYTPPTATDQSQKLLTPAQRIQQLRVQRKYKQLALEHSYNHQMQNLHSTLLQQHYTPLYENEWNARYEWWIQQRETTGKYPVNFDEYYTMQRDKENGVEEKTQEPQPTQQAARKAPAAAAKPSAAAAPTDPRKLKALEEAKKQEALKKQQVHIGPTQPVALLFDAITAYQEVWKSATDSANAESSTPTNPDLIDTQALNTSIATKQLLPAITSAVQTEVDIKLQQYLNDIRQKMEAMNSSKKKKRGKSKKGKKPTASGSRPATSTSTKKTKGAKKKKAAVVAPQAPQRPKCCEYDAQHAELSDAVTMLVKYNILQPVSGVMKSYTEQLSKPIASTFHSFIGPPTYYGVQSAVDPTNPSLSNLQPTTSQLKHTLIENYVYPHGSQQVFESVVPPPPVEVKKKTKKLAKSLPALLPNSQLLLYGAAGTGKRHLAQGIAHSTGAVWFDLSVDNIGRYLTSKQEILRLIHTVFVVAAALQPAIIYMANIESIIYAAAAASTGKKGKKSAAAKKRAAASKSSAPTVQYPAEHIHLRAAIVQHMLSYCTSIKPHRILLVGTTTLPVHASLDELHRFFNKQYSKIIYCPLPNYQHRLMLWHTFVKQTLTQQIVNVQAQSGVTSKDGLLKLVDRIHTRLTQQLDIARLAHLTDGYSAGSLFNAIQALLTSARVRKLMADDNAGVVTAANSNVHSSVSTQQVILALSKQPYVYKHEYERHVAMNHLITNEKERLRIVGLRQAEADAAAAERAKGKKAPAKKKAPAADAKILEVK